MESEKTSGPMIRIFARSVGLFLIVMAAHAGEKPPAPAIGDELDRYKEVPVYFNGNDIATSHGMHLSQKGFYYGQKWQCVEFVKRFLHDVKGHVMPDGYGHAKDYFDDSVPDGGWNEARGMFQYRNGGKYKPQPDDLIVFDGKYGHVAIVTEVKADTIEIIQQNRKLKTRETHALTEKDAHWRVGEKTGPLGWLRVKS